MTIPSRANHPIQYHQCIAGQWETVQTSAIVEQPVQLTVNGEPWLSFMCTPTNLEALAVGFLFNEGLIQAAEEIVQVRQCADGSNVDVWLNHRAEKPEHWRRTSGCTGGVTGVEANGQDSTYPQFFHPNGDMLTAQQVTGLIGQLFESQELYRQSGGVHTSALSDGQVLYVVAEDIGRHNTLDKIAGRCLLEGIQLNQRILLTTGRISSEMLQKAARIGASILVSRTAPSALAIHLAESWGITLIGYARRDRFNVYAHPERILPGPPQDVPTLLKHHTGSFHNET